MPASIIDGKAISAAVKAEVSAAVSARIANGKTRPGLAVVLVGNDAASEVYVRNKRKGCEAAGVYSESYDLAAETSEAELLSLIDKLNQKPEIHGILVQLPLPAHIDGDKVIDAIAPEKDVDGFHPHNIGRLLQRRPTLRPCTPYGVMRMLQEADMNPSGKHAVIVGASNIVGRPMALELMLAGATVTVCHSRSTDTEAQVARADIVVAAVGIPEYVKGSWIKQGAVVIDVGINRAESGGLVGDVEYAEAATRAAHITPVPGGVGPMTIAMLLQNTLEACEAIDG